MSPARASARGSFNIAIVLKRDIEMLSGAPLRLQHTKRRASNRPWLVPSRMRHSR
jgi:hypothetical protein